ncbi:MAG: SurA N-terminal domain-containing protein [Alphaproteobacteria bacterium]|nr:SurA N-terminal domain-containing protein [Alphaproteobacteria bacterium]
MISHFRTMTQTWVAKTLLVFMGVGMAFWGFGGQMISGSNAYIQIGSTSIPGFKVNEQIEREVNIMKEQLGPAFDFATARRMGLIDRIINDMVVKTLLELRASDIGVAISEARLADTISSFAAFRGADGKFDRARFTKILSDNKINEVEFVSNARRGLLRETFANAITAGLDAPIVAGQVWRFANQTVYIDMAIFRPELEIVEGAPTDADLQIVYDINIGEFQLPETRQISYMVISPEFAAGVKKLGAGADDNKRYRAMIEVAEGAIDDISGGADWAVVARARSGAAPLVLPAINIDGDTSDGKNIFQSNPLITRQVADFAFFVLDEGGISDVIETPGGALLVYVAKVLPARPKEMNEVRSELVALWRIAQQRTQAAAKSRKFAELLSGGMEASAAIMQADKGARFTPNMAIAMRASNLPDTVKQVIITTSVGGVFNADGYVGRIKRIQLGKVGEGEGFVDFIGSTETEFRNAIFDDYETFLRRRYRVVNKLNIN